MGLMVVLLFLLHQEQERKMAWTLNISPKLVSLFRKPCMAKEEGFN
jgi:hypothetical protein